MKLRLIISFILLLALGAFAQILGPILMSTSTSAVTPQTVVQFSYKDSNPSSATYTVGNSTHPWPSNVTAGNNIYGAGTVCNNTATISSVTDNNSNTYTCVNASGSHSCSGMATTPTGTANWSGFGFYATNVTGGAKPTITIVTNASQCWAMATAWEVNGGATSSPLDTESLTYLASGGLSGTDTLASPFMTTSVNGDVLFATGMLPGTGTVGDIAAGTFWTRDEYDTTSSFNYQSQHYVQPVSTAATATSFSPNATTNHWFPLVFAYKPLNALPGSGCVNTGLVDFSAGTATNAVAVADLQSSVHGLAPGWQPPTVTNGSSALKYATAAHHALLNSAPYFCYGNATYTDSGTVGEQYSTTIGGIQSQKIPLPSSASSTVAAGMHWSTTEANNAVFGVQDTFSIGTTGADFLTVQFQGNGTTLQLCFEGGTAGSGSGCVNVSNNTDYIMTINLVQNGTYSGAIYNGGTGVQVGSTFTSTALGNNAPNAISWGNINPGNATTGAVENFDKLMICAYANSCTFPVKP